MHCSGWQGCLKASRAALASGRAIKEMGSDHSGLSSAGACQEQSVQLFMQLCMQLCMQLSTSGCPCGAGLNQLGFPFGSHWWCLVHTLFLIHLNPEVRECCSCPPIAFPARAPSHQEHERKVRLRINGWGEEMQCLTCQLAISCDYSL